MNKHRFINRRTLLSSLASFAFIIAILVITCCSKNNDMDCLSFEYNNKSNLSQTESLAEEQIQNRLDDIGSKYGIEIFLADNSDNTKINELFFQFTDSIHSINSQKTRAFNGEFILDDTEIDNIPIHRAPTPTEPYSHSGTFIITATYNTGGNPITSKSYDLSVTVSWTISNTGNTISASLSNDHNGLFRVSNTIASFSGGNPAKPSINYSITIGNNAGSSFFLLGIHTVN